MFSPNSFVFHIQLFIHLCFLYINTIRGLYRRSLLSQNVHKEANSKIHCDSLCYTGNKSRLGGFKNYERLQHTPVNKKTNFQKYYTAQDMTR